MILFARDWQRYPDAIVDTKTANQSFLRQASVYRSMGVKNHAFPLALHDKRLQGLNPHDTQSIGYEEAAMVVSECKVNPWYYFREVARAPASGGSESVPVEANRGNIALWWLFFNHITTMLVQIRQTGKSFSTDVLMSLLLMVQCYATKINLMTKDDTLRRANIQRLKDIISDLPAYMQLKQYDDLNNTEEITVNALGNRYTTHVPQSSPKRAINMGRGLTTAIFHIDEAPFQSNIEIALPAALAAMSAAIDRAKEEQAPYGIIMTTTAGKKDDKDGKYVYKLWTESASWTERFFDCANKEELDHTVRRNSRGGVLRVAAEFNHRQLGKDDAWLRSKLEELMQSGDDANRDFFNMWTSGSQSSPLAIHILELIRGSVRTPLFEEIHPTGGYVIRWYIPEDAIDKRMNTGDYIIGMDTSEASGNDDISMVIIDTSTLEVVAAGTYNETNLIVFSQWVASILIRFRKTTAIIERRSTGATLIDYLLIHLPEAGIDPFQRLFNMVVHEKEEQPERFKEINVPMGRRDPSIYVRFKKFFGYATSGSGVTSRSALYSTTLRMATNKAAGKIYDKAIIDQITGLIIKNGRIDHEVGEHDDMVIGWLLCNWLIMQGLNLSFYGIDSKFIMADVDPPKVLDFAMLRQQHEQNNLRQQIDAVNERLGKERDEFICTRLEHELRVLMSKIIYKESEITSVDEMIRQARDRRQSLRRLNRVGGNTYGRPNWQNQGNPISGGYQRHY